MKILAITQGTPEWLAARAKYFCASEAPAMMGVSKYQTRNDLLRLKATGIAEDVDADKQALFDAGHKAEAAARLLVEVRLGAPLFPLVATDDNGYLLASFDGINDARTTGWEHKLWNEDLAAQVRAKELDPMYYWQLEQQIAVGGLKRVIFTVSDGTPERCVSMEYRAVAGRAQQLLAGWKQFEADLAAYQHVEVLPPAAATPTMQLPALSIQVKGSITLIDNLKIFGERLGAFIEGIDKNPSTDQAFADCEAAVKTLQTAQNALEAAEASALAQTASIDEMRRTVALYADQARTTRLMLEKLVKARKETIRIEIVQGGKTAFAEHVAGLNKRLGKPYMPVVPADFAGVIKGKKTVASLKDAVATELARAKIEANSVADRIGLNLNTLRELASEHVFLFADTAQIVLKEPDDLAALVKVRIAEHKEAEAKRLEQEREKIRAEEAARLEREAKETAAAQPPVAPYQSSSGPTRSDSTNRVSPSFMAASLNEMDSGNTAAPAAAPRRPPTRAQIIQVVAVSFNVDEATATGWLESAFQRVSA